MADEHSLRGHKWNNGDRLKTIKMGAGKDHYKTNADQACRWGFKPLMWEIRFREYKSTHVDKGLNYFISVKLPAFPTARDLALKESLVSDYILVLKYLL